MDTDRQQCDCWTTTNIIICRVHMRSIWDNRHLILSYRRQELVFILNVSNATCLLKVESLQERDQKMGCTRKGCVNRMIRDMQLNRYVISINSMYHIDITMTLQNTIEQINSFYYVQLPWIYYHSTRQDVIFRILLIK